MTSPLPKRTKAEAKVITALMVIALLLQKIDERTGGNSADNPAVNHIVAYIEEVTQRWDDKTKAAALHRISRARKRLTAKTADLDLAVGIVGAMRVLTGSMFRTKPGTRLDYIVAVFRKNLIEIEATFSPDAELVRKFEMQFKIVISQI